MYLVNLPQGRAPAPLVSVVGAGAIGGLLTGLLARAGRPVEVVCRPDQVDALARGLHVRTRHGVFSAQPPVQTAVSRQTALVVMAVKLPDLEAACQLIAQATVDVELPPVLLLQNGLAAVDVASRVLPLDRLVVGVVELGATMLTPGAITYTIPGRLIVGTPAGGDPGLAAATTEILRPAVPVTTNADIASAQRLKLIVNLNNGLSAATGLAIQQLYTEPAGLLLSVRLMREGVVVMDRAHLPLGSTPRTRLLRALLGLPDVLSTLTFRLGSRKLLGRLPVQSSTLQSVLRGRATEIDALNGAIVRLGQQHRVPTPANAAVVAAVERAAASRLPAFTSAEELLRAASDGRVQINQPAASKDRRGGYETRPYGEAHAPLTSRTTSGHEDKR